MTWIIALALMAIPISTFFEPTASIEENFSIPVWNNEFNPILPDNAPISESTRGTLDPAWGNETTNVPVCTAAGEQASLQLVPDGQGGAIITWYDYRSGTNDDIYAQRLSASGAALWTANGVAVCTATGDQRYPQMVPDGQGGVIIVWQDYRSGSNYDIYAQRLSASGVALWTANGRSVCTAAASQTDPQLVPDGVGGAVIAWQDFRSGTNYDVYAQQLSTNGIAQWTANGRAICLAAGNQTDIQLVPDGVGGALITWVDFRSGTNYDVYAQQLSTNGIAQWTANGAVVCTASGNQNDPQLVPDGVGGALITWQDFRSGSISDIYTQRVNAIGTVLWTANGVAVCSAAGNQVSSQLVPDGVGGALIVWHDYRGSNYDIYAQRVSASGAVLWKVNGVAVCTAAGHQYTPQLASDGVGGALITWMDYRSGGNYDIYAQRVSMNGISLWSRNGLAISTIAGDQRKPQITIDSRWLSGNQQTQGQSNMANEFKGIIITWQDYRAGNGDIYAQSINEDAKEFMEMHALDPRWGNETASTAVCTASGDQNDPQLVPDGQGGSIITWYDFRILGDPNIYAQRLSATGAALWGTDGVAVCTAIGVQWYPQVAPDGQGGAIITWHDYRSGANYNIYAQCLNANGVAQWNTNGVVVCGDSFDQIDPQLVPDGEGGALITWQDGRSGSNEHIYAQRLSASGIAQWDLNGMVICNAAVIQIDPQLVPDGEGGALITWCDYRSGNPDIYAQRVSASGAVLWAANGVAICTASGNQMNPQLVPDRQGGAVIAWQDYRGSNYDLYAQHVNASGVAEWAANGVVVCTASGNQMNPQLVSDGQGGVLITWQDYRSGNYNIYTQRLSEGGAVQWVANGVAVCTASGSQNYPQLVPDGQGGALITWFDYRSGTNDAIYAQRVSANGTVLWTVNGMAVCTAAEDQEYPQLVSDGQGGALITWQDFRSDANYDIYAQRISLTQSTVVVNEVMHAPTSGNEWVELYNPSQVSYDISGWTLVDNTNSVVSTVPVSMILAPGAYYVCNITAPSLDNDDWVALYDSDGTMRDYVCWGISEPFGTTHDAAVLAQHWTEGNGFYVDTFAHVPGQSIGRDMDSNDSNSKFDWDITSGKDAKRPTPGRMNWGLIEIPLNLGWNLISIPLRVESITVENVFSSISGKWDVVKSYYTLDVSDPWKTYRVGWAVNDLPILNNVMGIWLHVTDNCTLMIHGWELTSTNISIYAGWNLVGYPSSVPLSASVALIGTGADIVSIFQSTTPFILDCTDLSTVTMEAGKGYWVHVTSDTVWTVNW